MSYEHQVCPRKCTNLQQSLYLHHPYVYQPIRHRNSDHRETQKYALSSNNILTKSTTKLCKQKLQYLLGIPCLIWFARYPTYTIFRKLSTPNLIPSENTSGILTLVNILKYRCKCIRIIRIMYHKQP